MRGVSVFILMVSLFVATFSCTPEQEEEAAGIAAVDAEAFGAGVLTCMETGVGVLCPECCGALAAGAAAISSAESGTSQRGTKNSKGLAKHNESEVLLPPNFMVANNPYECAGVTHNKVLFQILNGTAKLEIQDIKEGKDDAINRIVSAYSDCKSMDGKDAIQLKEFIKQNIDASVSNLTVYKYQNLTQKDLFSKEKSIDAAFCENAYNEVLIIKRDSRDNTEAVVNHLNRKISDLLNDGGPIDRSKASKLGFLTVLKHSYYYWNN